MIDDSFLAKKGALRGGVALLAPVYIGKVLHFFGWSFFLGINLGNGVGLNSCEGGGGGGYSPSSSSSSSLGGSSFYSHSPKVVMNN